MLNHPKIDVNQPDKKGISALMWAADLNHQDIVIILLQELDIKVKRFIFKRRKVQIIRLQKSKSK